MQVLKEKIQYGHIDKNFSLERLNESKNEKFKNRNNIYVQNYKHASLRKISPFKIYFEKLINHHKKNIFMKTKNKRAQMNAYYCPQIFKLFFKYIHLMPLWSGVMINIWVSLNPQVSEIKNRLTNNPVENWFDQLKESLKLFLPAMPSEYANVVFTLINAFYEQHADVRKYKLKNYKNPDKDAKEKWSKHRIDTS